jgi:hypothetical protein
MTAPALNQAIQGQGGISADNLNTYVQSCDVASQLQSFVGTQGMQVYLRGINSVNDGGQGDFYWNATGTANDGYNNFAPFGAATGCWTRLSSEVTVPYPIWCTASGGNAIALTPGSSVQAYANGQLFSFAAPSNSSGAVTVAVGSLSALPLYMPNGTQANSGAIKAGILYIIAYIQAASYNSNNGAFVLTSSISGANPPTVTILTSGSGTYTPPLGVTWIEVEMIGAGGGGGGSGNAGGAGTSGGNTTFGALSANGGIYGSQLLGGTGGSATGGDVNIMGASGIYATQVTGLNGPGGGTGGSSPFGGAGPGGGTDAQGTAATTNSGSGGGGGGSTTSYQNAQGGGAGGYLRKLIVSPATSYAYAVGAGGNGGAAGGSGFPGGAGGSGIIIITEHYGD